MAVSAAAINLSGHVVASSSEFTPPPVPLHIASSANLNGHVVASSAPAAAQASAFTAQLVTSGLVAVGGTLVISFTGAAGAVSALNFGGAGAPQVASVTSSQMVITVPDPATFGDRSLFYGAETYIDITDGTTQRRVVLPGIEVPNSTYSYGKIGSNITPGSLYYTDAQLPNGPQPGADVIAIVTNGALHIPTGYPLANASTVILYMVRNPGESAWPAAYTTVTAAMDAADNTPPVITLLGAINDTLLMSTGEDYTDPGATAQDNIDGDITASITVTGVIDRTIVGPQTLVYNVVDAAGNSAASVTRTVTVVDDVRPVLTLLGSANETFLLSSGEYQDQGATALDNVDGDITASITVTGVIDHTIVGSQTLVYNVTDEAGNAAIPLTRTVTVVDDVKPVITLRGGDITLDVGEAFTDPGFDAVDNIDGDITASVTVIGSVNTDVIGFYSLVYFCSDAAGNQALPVTRRVQVRAISAPQYVSAAVNVSGTRIDIVFNEPVLIGEGGNSGFTLAVGSRAIELNYLRGDGTNTLTYRLDSPVYIGQIVLLEYHNPGEGIANLGGALLAALDNAIVTNNSVTARPTGRVAINAFTDRAGTQRLAATNVKYAVLSADLTQHICNGVFTTNGDSAAMVEHENITTGAAYWVTFEYPVGVMRGGLVVAE